MGGASAASFAATWLAGAVTSVARACPDCDLGRVARNQFWSDGFAVNLAVALAPFLLIAALAAWAEVSRG